METDVEMQDENTTKYPDPNSEYLSPYPSISQSSTEPTSTFDRLFGSAAWSTTPNPRPGFTNLADYFNLGSSTSDRRPAQTSTTTPDKQNVTLAPVSPGDIQSPSSDNDTSTSLPGFHVLPENDPAPFPPFIDRQFQRTEQIDADNNQPNGRGRPRGSSSRGQTRATGEPRGRGRPRRSWKWAIRGTEHDTNVRKSRAKPARKAGRPRAGMLAGGKRVDPGKEFSTLYQQAVAAWMESDLEKAHELASLAVKANPEVWDAYSLIYQVLRKQGNAEGACVALYNWAVAKKDAEIYMRAGEEFFELGRSNGNRQDIDRALAMLNEATSIAKTWYELRAEKLRLYTELKLWSKARAECAMIVRMWPDKFDHVKEFASLCDISLDVNDWRSAKDAYDISFFHCANLEALGSPEEQWTHLNIYLELVNKIGAYPDGVVRLKRYARWFLGRKDDTFWDEYTEEDIEFDSTHHRRVLVWQFQQGRISHNTLQYGDGLPLDIRVKLGLFRLKMAPKYHLEAIGHFEHILPVADKIEEYWDMFMEVADSLRQHRLYGEAIRYYEPLQDLDGFFNMEELLTKMAKCYESVGRIEDMKNCYLAIMELNSGNEDVEIRLAETYQSEGWKEKAEAMVVEIERKRAEISSRPRKLPLKGTDINERSQNDAQSTATIRKTTARQDIAERIQAEYTAVKQIWESIDAGADEQTERLWMHHATALAQEFRGMSVFFTKGVPTGRAIDHAINDEDPILRRINALKQKLDLEIIDDGDEKVNVDGTFHNVAFREWHRILSTLVLLHAKYVEQEQCCDLLQEVLMRANVFRRSSELMSTNLAICIYCTLEFNDESLVAEFLGRNISRTNLDSETAAQLMSVCGRICHSQNTAVQTKVQKLLARWVKEKDYATMPPEPRAQFEWGSTVKKLDQFAQKVVGTQQELDASLLTNYAHASDRDLNALPNMFRALALEPENATVNLSIAVTFIEKAMSGTSTNRHYDIVQGQAFMQRYYNARIFSGKTCHLQEAEYNTARMWHQLGLTHLAIPVYEKVLKLSEQVQKEIATNAEGDKSGGEDYAKEAAYALQLIFASAGNMEAAQKITEEWLIL